ncbi:MAG: bifunctional UDP-N-acetylglucosamine diphosphorylase/glucosamine-1-phosphate N-acetyltransferase GlmU [Paracoccaceae bacterium]
MQTALIILAAGKGTRMNSDIPKVLHPIAGASMLEHVLKTGQALDPARMIVITGHGAEAVEKAAQKVNPAVQTARQTEQLGTGHAVAQAKQALDGFTGLVLVLFGDTPFIQQTTLENMRDAAEYSDVVVLGFTPDDPGRYGRLILDGMTLERIVEFKDASPAERAVTLCNGGLMACKADVLFDLLSGLANDNAAGEYYLTDIVGLAREQGKSAGVVTCDESETMGINSRQHLADAEEMFQNRTRAEMLDNGITLSAPHTVYFSHDTVIGRDCVIEPNVVFGPGVTVESGVHIKAFSHLEGCHISRGGDIGPYARLRPGAELQEDVKIGNFVEVKNTQVAPGAKINHLSYVGDADVGARANIGAGTITCNYDGVFKHRTQIGQDAFIGSNTMLVAPVSIGAGALTGSGSVITTDVPDGDLALGRAQQTNKPGLARKLMDMLRAKKAKQSKGA